MNVRGERILIFGDSLTHYGADSTPEIWEPTSLTIVNSSAPGAVLASLLRTQGAAAVRTNARVSRSAASFYDREDATGLLNADRAWRPTKVIVMLGTNDIGRSISKTMAAMAGIKSAYEGMGAEVWAVGPFTYNNANLNAQAPEVVQVMQNVFGSRFIDGRPLSMQTGRTGDGVHFGAAAAKQTALNIANAVMSTSTPTDMLGVMALGAAIGIGAFALFKLFSDPEPKPRRQMMSGLFGQMLLGPPVESVPPIDDEDDDADFGSKEWMVRLDARKQKRDSVLRRALEQNDAVIMTLKGGRRVLLVKSGEMHNTDEGTIRVTEFDDDGPIGHMTRKSVDKLAADIMRDWHPATIEPASEAEVMEMMGTERFAEGSRRVAEVQKHNAGLKSAKGYRVAYTLVTRRDGEIVTVRAIVDAPRPLTLAEAEKWRRQWGKNSTAWVETIDGEHVPVKGAKRPAKFVDDARPGDVHASLTR